MKINEQDLSSLFRGLPWQHKIIVASGVVFILFVLAYVPFVVIGRNIAAAHVVEAVRIADAPQPGAGVLDPSLAYDPQQKRIMMAYTSEERAADDGRKMALSVRLAIARNGNCEKWVHVPGGFEGKVDDILAPDSQTVLRSGAWRVETPSLVYDPDDHGKEWKLYAYKYFWANDPKQTLQVAQHYGMVVYKYASDPGGEWSTEQWLFSPAPDYPPAPYETMVLLHLNSLDPSLADVVAYARPSVIYKGGALIMTLSAFTGESTPDRVIMVVSLDHGNSWRYVGTPLRKADVAGMGPYTLLAGASLMEQDGQVFLAAVLGDAQQRGRGVFILGFDDVAKGQLTRQAKTGAPIVLNHPPLPKAGASALGGGFSAYTDACKVGMLTTEQSGGTLQTFKTYVQPFNKK